MKANEAAIERMIQSNEALLNALHHDELTIEQCQQAAAALRFRASIVKGFRIGGATVKVQQDQELAAVFERMADNATR